MIEVTLIIGNSLRLGEGIIAAYTNKFFAQQMLEKLNHFKKDEYSFHTKTIEVVDINPVYCKEEDDD